MKSVPCSVADCNKPARTRGYCNAHYLRFNRHGDPLAGGVPRDGEAWRFAETLAASCQSSECVPWPYTPADHGYGQVQKDGRRVQAHRLVCELAHGLPPSPKHEATHDCGNGHLGCVNPRHLSWKTHAGNMADKLLHGTHNRGEQHNLAKLSEDQVREIISSKGVMSQREIGERHGVTQSCVSHIQRGKSWSWLNEVAP